MTTFIYNERNGEFICEYCAGDFREPNRVFAVYGEEFRPEIHNRVERDRYNLPNALCAICDLPCGRCAD